MHLMRRAALHADYTAASHRSSEAPTVPVPGLGSDRDHIAQEFRTMKKIAPWRIALTVSAIVVLGVVGLGVVAAADPPRREGDPGRSRGWRRGLRGESSRGGQGDSAADLLPEAEVRLSPHDRKVPPWCDI